MKNLYNLEENEHLRFVNVYFEKTGLEVIRYIDRKNQVDIEAEFLAKDLKTGRNHTFIVNGGELKKLVHYPRNKFNPWQWVTVARRVAKKSYIKEMRAAIHADDDK